MKNRFWISILVFIVVFSSCFVLLGNQKALAEEQKVIQWKLASCWAGRLQALLDADRYFAERVNKLSNGKLQIKVYPAGELCSANEVLEMVSSGAVEAGGDVPCYWGGKNSVFDLLCTSQVGFTAEDYMSWIYQAGGFEIYNEMYGKFNCLYFPHNLGHMESGIRSKKPIYKLTDLKGKKIRMSGIVQSKLLQHYGGKPVSISVAELYEAIRRGTIDGAEVSNPYNDKSFHVEEVAKYWLAPGWHQTGVVYGIMVNQEAYQSLPEYLQEIIKSAARDCLVEKTTFMVFQDALATQYFIDQGVQINRLTKEELDDMKLVRNKIQEELAASNPDYAKALKSQINYLKLFAPYRSASAPFIFGVNQDEYPNVE